MAPLEMIAEWRKGCSCASIGKPEECHACTRGLIEALDKALRKLDPFKEDRAASLVTKYSNKILELDGADMEQGEIPLLLTEFLRELEGRPKP